MALIARSLTASLDLSTAQLAPQISPLRAGEIIDPLANCRISKGEFGETAGLVYMCDATAANGKAAFDGISPKKVLRGEAMELFGPGTRMKYSDGLLTPGQTLYMAATKGRMDDAATVGDAVGVARAINQNDIRITRFV
jgi:hypothetical protein